MKLHLLLAAAALTLAGAAFAQAPVAPAGPLATPRIDQRQANQQQRINQGVSSGQVTRREAARLQQRQDRFAVHKARARADGVVTPAERRQLRREQQRANRAIYRQKHNRQVAARAR